MKDEVMRKKLHILSAFVFAASFVASSASACGSADGYSNPIAHQPYVGDGCVYYGQDGGYIVSGEYKGLVISDELLSGFQYIKNGEPDRAFTEWLTLSALGNRSAQYNVGRMLHIGWGTRPSLVSALNFLFEAMNSDSHYNTANVEATRILQASLIGLGYLKGKADGEYGDRTDRAVDAAIADLSDSGPNPDSEYWYYWAIAEKFERENGAVTERPGQPVIQDAVPEIGRESMPDYLPEVVIADPSIEVKRSDQVEPEFSAFSNEATDIPDLYARISPSVHMIFAAEKLDDFQTFDNVMQGSAVAISEQKLLTNCHVVDGHPYLVIIKNGVPVRGVVTGGDSARDTCFIETEEAILNPIRSMRLSTDVAVGERVITIGSPKGQENSLSEGVVSGLREFDQVSYLQITAPISPGSSGGGLFDMSGNLLGITTMLLEDGQSLNFAISVEEFQ